MGKSLESKKERCYCLWGMPFIVKEFVDKSGKKIIRVIEHQNWMGEIFRTKIYKIGSNK